MRITVGNYEVYETGSVFGWGTKPIRFLLADDLIVGFVVIYTEDEPGESPKAKFEVITDTELRLNINLPRGVKYFPGFPEPMEIGVLNNRKLLFNFKATRIELTASSLLAYTWYLGERVDNEK